MLEQYNDVLTTEEASEALRIGYNALYELLNNGKLKGYRNGRVWRVPKLAIQRIYIEKCAIEKSIKKGHGLQISGRTRSAGKRDIRGRRKFCVIDIIKGSMKQLDSVKNGGKHSRRKGVNTPGGNRHLDR